MTETGELRAFWDDDVVGEIPAALLTDECPRYEVDRLEAARPPRRGRSGQPGAEGVDLRAVRPARSLAHGAPARARRGGAAAAAVLARPRDLARRAAARLPRPARGGSRGGARRGAQRRLRRRRAARADRLPQLRQPREAGDRLGAGRGDRGHRRDGRGAGDSGRLGQRLALQRDRRAGDSADAGRRAASASCPTSARCRVAGGRATASGWPRATRSS